MTTRRRWLRLLPAALLLFSSCSGNRKATGTPEVTSTPTTGPGSLTTGAGAMVPSGFTAFDVTWIGQLGWALGTVPSDCASRPCTSVVHSRDGGHTWIGLPAPKAYVPFFDGLPNGAPICTPATACVEGIRFATAEIGYIFGQNSLWLTTNGGQSWTERSADNTVALEVANGQVIRVVQPGGFCTGGCLLQVEAAAVGTTSWHSFSVPALAGYNEALVVEGPNIYLEVLGDGGPTQFYRSTDHGAQWTTLSDPCPRTAPGQAARAVAMSAHSGGLLAVACTASGEGTAFAVVSTDAGATFGRPGAAPLPATAVGPNPQTIRDIAAPSGKRLAVLVTAGSTAYICASNDAGTSWGVTEVDKLVPRNGANYFKLRFGGGTAGWALETGYAFTTADGGQHWTPFTFRT